MRITLEFDLPEEASDLKMMLDGPELMLALSDFERYLRAQVKYHTEETRDNIFEIREQFFSTLNDRRIDLDSY